MFLQNWLFLLPELSIIGGIIVSIMLQALRSENTPKTFFTVSKYSLLVALLSTIIFYNKSAFPALWHNTYYTTLFKTVLLFVALSWFYVSSKWFLGKNKSSFDFYTLAMTEVLLLELLISVQHLLLAIILMIGVCWLTGRLLRLYQDQEEIAELTKLYGFFTIIFSLLFLGGYYILYQEVLSGDLLTISHYLEQATQHRYETYFAVGMIISGMLFLLALAPFHSCFVAIVSTAILPVSGFVSLVPVLAYWGFFLPLILKTFAPFQSLITVILVSFSGISLFIGAFSANGATNLRRLFAYSTVYHMGFMVLGVLSYNNASLLAVFVYLLVFIMAMFGIYSGFMGFKSRGEYLVDLEDIRGASNARPYISAAFLVFMFSLIGMPPMSGFLGLISIINNLISSHGWLMLGMVLLSLLLMSNAYLQLIRKIYFEPQNLSFDRTDKAIYICLLVNIILVATTMINPSFLFKDAAKVLSGGF